jgi:hypothetical protein
LKKGEDIEEEEEEEEKEKSRTIIDGFCIQMVYFW